MKNTDTIGLDHFDVANWFICHIDREAGDSITHLKLQKLLYYAQAWTLVLKKKSLFKADFEAWAHGPVIPAVYDKFKEYGYDSLPLCDCDFHIPEEAEEILLEVKRIYGERSAKYLEELTHQEDPWIIARGPLAPETRCSSTITKDSMEAYYQSLLVANEQ